MKLPLAVALCWAATPLLFGQPAMPAWLEPYPGAAPQTRSYLAMVTAAYTAGATPDQVTAHYRKLFEAHGLQFHPNPDGVGVSVRGASPECDLLITIRARDEATSVNVSCASNQPLSPQAAPPPPPSHVIAGGQAAIMERHAQKAEEMGLHKVRQDAPAPPLVWPAWLTSVEGGKVNARATVDYAGNPMLKARYATSAPMSSLFAFYKDLLTANDYPVHSGVLSKNGDGHVEGTNYPEGSPGPRTEIYVGFSRMHLNEPITVDLRFTTYAYRARKPL